MDQLLTIEEVRSHLLSQSSVEVLHVLYFDCMSHVLRDYLNDPITLELICKNYRIPTQLSILSFFKVYNREYLLIEKQYEWYVMYHLQDIPIMKALKRAARYEYYDTLDVILTRERLWCSKPHMMQVSKEVYFNDPERALRYCEHVTSENIKDYLTGCEILCIKRGKCIDPRHITDTFAMGIAAGNGHWELSLRYATNDRPNPIECVLNSCRYDLLEESGDRVKNQGHP